MNALYVGFEVFGFYFLKIWHTCFGGSFKIQSFFFAVYCIPTAVSVTFSVNMKETLSDFMCSSRRAAALICALVIDNVHHGPLTRLLRLS